MKSQLHYTRLFPVVTLCIAAGCQTFSEQPPNAPPVGAMIDNSAGIENGVEINGGGCSTCGYEVSVTPATPQPHVSQPPAQPLAQQAQEPTVQSHLSPPASRPFLTASNQQIKTASKTTLQSPVSASPSPQPIPQVAGTLPSANTVSTNEWTAKRVAGLLTQLVSPTEEEQNWAADSPYLADLNETLESAAVPVPETSRPTQTAPVVTQVEFVTPQPLSTTPPQAPAQIIPKRSPMSSEPGNQVAPISRAEYEKLVQTLSVLQTTLQSQNPPPAGDGATDSAK